jgi:hypothetical protein
LWAGSTLCLIILLFKSNSKSVVWHFIQILSFLTLVGAALLIGQGKGFDYHAIPAQYTLIGAIALLMAPAMREVKVAVPYGILNSALVAIFLVASLVCVSLVPRAISGAPIGRITQSSAIAREIERNTAQFDRVAIISTTPSHAYPVLTQLDRRPGTRFLWFFPVSMIYKGVKGSSGSFPYRAPKDQSVEEKLLLSDLAEDIAKNQPRLVFIHDGCAEGCPPRFSLYDYLTRVGFIDKALKQYGAPRRIKDMMVYHLRP